MELQEKVQKVRNLVDDDETLKSWIKRAHQGWITGWELVALEHYFIYDPDNKDQSSEEIVEDWSKIIDWGLTNKKIIPYSKHSFRPLDLEELENLKGDDWLIAVNDADHLVESSLRLEPFCGTTIDFLFKEIYPEDTKKLPESCNTQRKHTTNDLKILDKAIEKFWEDHDPKRPPKKGIVVAWLVEQGVSSTRIAESMDTIMRTPKARIGGNKPRTQKSK